MNKVRCQLQRLQVQKIEISGQRREKKQVVGVGGDIKDKHFSKWKGWGSERGSPQSSRHSGFENIPKTQS